MEVYIDDIITKFLRADDYVDDLWAIFISLKGNKIKLIPEKCAFGVSSGKFNVHSIEANLDKWQPTNDNHTLRLSKRNNGFQ